MKDNLDAAQEIVDGIDLLTGRGELELASGPRELSPDTTVRIAMTRTLIDIGRSLRGIETAINEGRCK